MKIFLTGGAGFIASHIADAYIKEGHKVIVIDNLSSGRKENLNKKAIFHKINIKSQKSLRDIFKKYKPELVNHHAAVSEVIKSLKNPLLTYETNINGTLNLLLVAGEFKVKKFIFASTGGAIYGNQKKLPVKENVEPNPLSPYALSKLIGENFIKFYSRFFGFDYLILRYANVYGPRQNPKGEAGVVAIFSDLVKKSQHPIIFGNGNKTRDYIFVEDVARANAKSLKLGRNETVNIGCSKEIKDREVFENIAKELHFRGKPYYAPLRKGEVMRIALDSDLAEKVIDWKPKYGFSDGIKKYLST